MKMSWSRESALVILMAVMVLLAGYYFGHQKFVDPIKAEGVDLKAIVRVQHALIDSYPPSKPLFAEYIADSNSTEDYMPSSDQFNAGLVRLEELAKAANVQLQSVSRSGHQAGVEGVADEFVMNTYSVQVQSESPSNFRSLIHALMQEKRVWNVTSLSYSGSSDSYSGNFNVAIYYFLGGDVTADAMTDIPETAE